MIKVPNKVAANYADYLGKELDFVEALQTEFVQDLMAMWLNEADRLLAKIIAEKANKEEKAEFRVIRRIIDAIVERVKKFNSYHEEYQKMILKEQKKGAIK